MSVKPEQAQTVHHLPRVPAQGSDSPTVTAPLNLHLVASPGVSVRVPACLRYDSRDPYAVFLDIHAERDTPIIWTFARELLATGLKQWAGVGDVTVHPGAGGVESVFVSLRGETGGALLRAMSSEVRTFLWRTERLVPTGAEREHYDLDLLLGRLLEHPSPRAGLSDGNEDQ